MTGGERPTFGEIAEALLALVRYDAELEAWAEPFMARVAENPGIADAYAQLRRRMILVAEGQRLLALMAPLEQQIRAFLVREGAATLTPDNSEARGGDPLPGGRQP